MSARTRVRSRRHGAHVVARALKHGMEPGTVAIGQPGWGTTECAGSPCALHSYALGSDYPHTQREEADIVCNYGAVWCLAERGSI